MNGRVEKVRPKTHPPTTKFFQKVLARFTMKVLSCGHQSSYGFDKC